MEVENEILIDSRHNLVAQLHYAIFPTYDNDTFMEIICTAEASKESKDLLNARHGDRLETALQRWVLSAKNSYPVILFPRLFIEQQGMDVTKWWRH